jgi:trimeric autotransporter adhesin
MMDPVPGAGERVGWGVARSPQAGTQTLVVPMQLDNRGLRTAGWLAVYASFRFFAGAATGPGDENWETFASAGADGTIAVLRVVGTNLYAGGSFRAIGGAAASGLAQWDGAKWSAVGNGVSGGSLAVSALLVTSNGLIVGGNFTSAGDLPATNIARWDGTNWTAMGSLPGPGYDGVHALAEFHGQVYAGGAFTRDDGAAADYLARWDGSQWAPVGAGVDEIVYALETVGNALFVGGYFSSAGGVNLTRGIARWDGINWSPLVQGVNLGGEVYALAARGTNLYVGGYFTQAGGVSAAGLAVWVEDLQRWQSLNAPAGTTIFGLRTEQDRLYLGGRFPAMGGISSSNVVLLGPAGWEGLGGGVSEPSTAEVSAIAEYGGQVFVGGTFQLAGGAALPNIARWTGGQWASAGTVGVGLGLDAAGSTTILVGTNVYVGGKFSRAGALSVNRVARWTGSGWAPLGGQLPFTFASGQPRFATDGQQLYATSLGDKGVWRWDTTNWFLLGSTNSTTPGIVTPTSGFCAVCGTNFYASGRSTGVTGPVVGKFDGTNWRQIGPFFTNDAGQTSSIGCLAAASNGVYAAGFFGYVGTLPARAVAFWDGTQWNALGAGVPDAGTVGFVGASCLSLIESNLYVASAQNYRTSAIYRWNGSAWSALPGVFKANNAVSSIAAIRQVGTDLYVSGSFDTVDGQPASHIARWDGTRWNALGSGLNDAATITVDDRKVYATGSFSTAGGKATAYFGIWDIPPVSLILSASANGSGLRLAWPVNVSTAVLKFTPSLETPQWQPVLGTPAVVNGRNSLDVPCPGTNGFFGLRSP